MTLTDSHHRSLRVNTKGFVDWHLKLAPAGFYLNNISLLQTSGSHGFGMHQDRSLPSNLS